ncbi:MAG: phage tail tape measure protein [Pseudomonadota bacterium]
MGSAQQIAALKTIVGEEAIAGFAELIEKEGIGALQKYAEQLNASGGTAEKMAQRMNDTLVGSVRGMSSAFESLQISLGTIFLPVARAGIDAITSFLRILDAFTQSTFGAFIVKSVAVLASLIIAITIISGIMWAWSAVCGVVAGQLALINTALLGITWPIWLIVGAIGLLYLAYTKNFGGIADIVNSFFGRFSLIVKEIVALFDSLTGSTFEIRGELAKDIKAAGLEKLLVSIGKVLFGVKKLFDELWQGITDGVDAIMPMLEPLLSGLGDMLAGAFSFGFEAIGLMLSQLMRGFDSFVSLFRMIIALFTGDFGTATAMAQRIWDNFCTSLMAFADFFTIGDWIREAWASAVEYLSSLNLFDSGAKLLGTFIESITSKALAVKDTVVDALSGVRNLLPFSDAKEGPLSTLTLSRERLMSTIGEGVLGESSALKKTVSTALGHVGDSMQSALQGFSSDTLAPQIPAPIVANPEVPEKENKVSAHRGDTSITVHIGSISLPNVANAEGFLEALQETILEYTGEYGGAVS